MDGSAPYWVPVVTLAIGATFGFLADFLREGHSARRGRQAAADAFERDTLIALQDALSNVARAALVIHQYDERIYRDTAQWGRQLLLDGMLDEFGPAANDVTRHRVRVRDDAIRENAENFAAWCVIAQTGAQGDEEDAEARQRAVDAKDRLSEMLRNLNEQIGERLRRLL
jgi:hypothetical protein